jgi:hypothetical protein
MEIEEVRQMVKGVLQDMGRGSAAPRGEQPLSCDRYPLGVRFSFDGISALWLSAAAQIRFVDDDGRLLKIVGLTVKHGPGGRAA